jgi:hypothetical protein
MLTLEERRTVQLPGPDNVLGSGSYGTVYRVFVEDGSPWAALFPNHSGTDIAVKEYRVKSL